MKHSFFMLAGGAVILLLVFLVGGFLLGGVGECRDFSASTLTTPTHTLRVGVAMELIEQSRGLGGCKRIPKDAGLYFPYSAKQNAVYWMKGMVIPIDIVWITDGEVVGVEAHVPPPTGKLDQELIRYKPPRAVTAVLEVGAGKAAEYGLVPGAKVQFIP